MPSQQQQHKESSETTKVDDHVPRFPSSFSTVPSLAIFGTMSDAGKSIIAAGICRIFANHGIRVAPFKGQNMSNNAAPALLPADHIVTDLRRRRTTTTNTNTNKNTDANKNKQHESRDAHHLPSKIIRDEDDDDNNNNNNDKQIDKDVTPMYGEIGTAQALQARACRQIPRVEMNPVLLKSGGRRECDGAYMASVFVLGKQVACEDFGSLGQRSETLLEYVLQAHQQLIQTTQAQIVVMEGAGSCTELNLLERDIVNLPLVRRLLPSASWLLVANIDCGGVFAQIVGTKACLPPSDWDACVGIVVNKLRGDAKYFEPGPAILQELVGKPIFVVPYLYNLHLAEEDGLGVERRLAKEWTYSKDDHHEWFQSKQKTTKTTTTTDFSPTINEAVEDTECQDGKDPTKPLIIVIAYPHVSMADDLALLESDDRFIVQWRRESKPPPYPRTTSVILPGSRLTRSDLQWLHESGWSEWILQHVEAGGHVLGLCGGYQMLGHVVADEMGVEGQLPPGSTMGLGLLPVQTVIRPVECKRVTPRAAYLLHAHNDDGNTIAAADVAATATANKEIRVEGFELHCGETHIVSQPNCHNPSVVVQPLLRFTDDGEEFEGFSTGRVKGTYLHGILHSAPARRQLLVPSDADFDDHTKSSSCQATTGSNKTEDDDLDRLARHLEDCGLTFDTLSKLCKVEFQS